VNRTCVNPSLSCNCDISEAKWHSDEGFFENPNSLGITEMVFLQQKDLASDALGRITLGPLECVETSKFLIYKNNVQFSAEYKNKRLHINIGNH